jgi:hypothetical protein
LYSSPSSAPSWFETALAGLLTMRGLGAAENEAPIYRHGLRAAR